MSPDVYEEYEWAMICTKSILFNAVLEEARAHYPILHEYG